MEILILWFQIIQSYFGTVKKNIFIVYFHSFFDKILNLYIEYLVKGFAMTEPNTHSICRSNIIGKGESRMAIIIRVIHEENRIIARRHLQSCNNDDEKLKQNLLKTCTCHIPN